MKQKISFERLLFMMLILSSCLLYQACQKDVQSLTPYVAETFPEQKNEQASRQEIAATSTIGRIYLDLTKDQMIVGGITDNMLKSYQQQGYQLKSFEKDTFAKGVKFKRTNGTLYYQDGWLKKGATYLISKASPYIIIRQCGNDWMFPGG